MPPELLARTDLENFRGAFSYKPVWSQFYAEALVLGSRLSLRLTRPLYPRFASHIFNGEDPTGNLVPPTDIRNTMMVPADAMYGFWYIRVRYCRAFDGDEPRAADYVGHPVTNHDTAIWRNMRDFQSDASVS